jgi:2,4-didehydro-3-deoxy-L-rhamnonate hydrolase
VRTVNLAELAQVQGRTLRRDEVRLLSPVTREQQFICQGANYRQHMIESGLDPDQKNYNMIFTKAASCIVPANHDVIIPRSVQLLDYEVELGLVLKRDILGSIAAGVNSLHQWVAGLVIVNDYSARDIQLPQSQFYKGKSFRTFGPVGPYLCLLSPEDFPLLDKLQLTLKVNGEVRQNDSTANLVHSPAATLNELSTVQDLFAGDLLSTGTPAGCALAVPPPWKQKVGTLLSEESKWRIFIEGQRKRSQYLKHGDVVTASIRTSDGEIDLGQQTNRIVSEREVAP